MTKIYKRLTQSCWAVNCWLCGIICKGFKVKIQLKAKNLVSGSLHMVLVIPTLEITSAWLSELKNVA